MRTGLLGLELTQAAALIEREGIVPQVTITAAPKMADREGTLRVVYVSDDGKSIIASRFVDPIAKAQAEE